MKANELRLGNYVLGPNNNKICKVFILSGKCEDNHESINGYDCKCIEPVLLTEEWLLKLGFQKTNCFKNKEMIIELGLNDIFHARKRITPESSIYICDVEYVHQLQNLYYALTGEELCTQ